MPELPEVETVKRYLDQEITGNKIVSVEIRRPNLRIPFPHQMSKRLMGSKVIRLQRVGKYILANLSTNETLIIHLGMSGAFKIHSPPVAMRQEFIPSRHDHVILIMESQSLIVYSDPRRFGLMDIVKTKDVQSHPFIKTLGTEPLSEDFCAKLLYKDLKKRRTSIKSVLLNQSIIAGLGNIYACESLWKSGISPLRRCDRISFARILLLTDCVQTVLQEAIEAGGSTLRDYHAPNGVVGYFQHHFKVYGKENQDCQNKECDGKIVRIVQAGRSTFYCRTCQK